MSSTGAENVPVDKTRQIAFRVVVVDLPLDRLKVMDVIMCASACGELFSLHTILYRISDNRN
jgi:hypothetical protein